MINFPNTLSNSLRNINLSTLSIKLKDSRINIACRIKDYGNPLDVFRLINIVAPRDWKFTFRFDSCGQSLLYIASDPMLSNFELFKILDGSINIIYGFNDVSIKLEDGTIFGLVRDEINDLTFYNYVKKDLEELDGNIKIDDILVAPVTQVKDKMEEWLYDSTWLGSKKYENRSYCVKMDVYGHKYEVKNGRRFTSSHEKQYIVDMPIKDGDKIIGMQLIYGLTAGNNNIRHEIYGNFNVNNYYNNFWSVVGKVFTFPVNIEYNTPEIAWYSAVGPQNANYIKNFTCIIINNLQKLIESDLLIDYKKYLIEYKKIVAAKYMRERAEDLEKQPKVIVNRREFFKLPTCENELVALYMKLEGANLLPFECKIMEYTPKIGIDSIGHFRFKNTEDMIRYAPIEFEYNLENYFSHQHPVEQTRLIIAWDSYSNFEEIDNIHQSDHKWLYYIKMMDRIIPCIIVKYFPTVIIKN